MYFVVYWVSACVFRKCIGCLCISSCIGCVYIISNFGKEFQARRSFVNNLQVENRFDFYNRMGNILSLSKPVPAPQ